MDIKEVKGQKGNFVGNKVTLYVGEALKLNAKMRGLIAGISASKVAKTAFELWTGEFINVSTAGEVANGNSKDLADYATPYVILSDGKAKAYGVSEGDLIDTVAVLVEDLEVDVSDLVVWIGSFALQNLQ